uniref:Ribosomal protein L24 n=1 Tax=Cryptomonas curvata TaxID=233186 RepID=A0A679C9E1_9CRYP|nr:ribosomal protein L24 [Cryptomonas curvata]
MTKNATLYIKKGDTIKVISGKDKGKIGEVTQILRHSHQVIIKDINIKKKHIKPKKEGEVGRISQFEAPIDASNVMLYSLEKKVASRICMQIDANGTKIRVLKKLL